MSKFTKIKLELAKMLAKFNDVKTSAGVLTYDGSEDEDLRAGMSVYTMDTDTGEYAPAADGEYVTEDGKTIVVKDGKVESITDPKAEVDPEEDRTVEVDAACGTKRVKAEEVADPAVETDGVKETETDAIDAIHREINELYDIVDKLVKKVAELEGKSEATEKTVEKMSKMSAAFSAEETLENKTTAPISGIAEIDRKLKNFIG
jgi:hypothetical protein